MKNITLATFLILLTSQQASALESTTGYKVFAVAGLILSTLALGYAIAGTVVGSLDQSPQHLDCGSAHNPSSDSIVYCNEGANGTRQCSNTQTGNQTAYCIRTTPWKNPKWAQDLRLSGIILLPLTVVGLISFAAMARTEFSR